MTATSASHHKAAAEGGLPSRNRVWPRLRAKNVCWPVHKRNRRRKWGRSERTSPLAADVASSAPHTASSGRRGRCFHRLPEASCRRLHLAALTAITPESSTCSTCPAPRSPSVSFFVGHSSSVSSYPIVWAAWLSIWTGAWQLLSPTPCSHPLHSWQIYGVHFLSCCRCHALLRARNGPLPYRLGARGPALPRYLGRRASLQADDGRARDAASPRHGGGLAVWRGGSRGYPGDGAVINAVRLGHGDSTATNVRTERGGVGAGGMGVEGGGPVEDE